MLFQHLDRLSAHEVLLMDRAYPCRWLVALLIARYGLLHACRKIRQRRLRMRRDFVASDKAEQIVTLLAPVRRDASDYKCPVQPQTVRLVRHVASTRKVRVLIPNLLDEPPVSNCCETTS